MDNMMRIERETGMTERAAVPLSKLDIRYSALRALSKASIQGMIHSMEKHGQLTPIVVTGDAGRWIVIDGFKRQKAAEVMGITTLMVVVLQGDDACMKAHMYLLNRKSGFSLIEEGILVRELVEKDGLQQTETAALLNRHKSWVCRRLEMMRRLSAQMIEDLKLGLIPPGSAQALARLPHCNQADFSALIQTYRLSVRQIAPLIDLWCKAKEPESKAFLLTAPLKALTLASGKETEEKRDPRIPVKVYGWLKAVQCLERVAGILCLKSTYAINAPDKELQGLLITTLERAEEECQKALSLAHQAIQRRYSHEQTG